MGGGFGYRLFAMKELFIDLETYSSIDLGSCGVYKYAASPDFEVLLFGYSVDGGAVTVVDVARGEVVPEEIIAALTDVSVTKYAYNCAFERTCLSAWLEVKLPPDSWKCHMVWAATLGLPLSLAAVGAVLKLDEQKMGEGKDLIRYFCIPCKPTKTNGMRTRNLPDNAPDKWNTFVAYNKRDVETELAIHNRLAKYPVPDFVWEEYHRNETINDRGVRIDRTMAEMAIEIDGISSAVLEGRLATITGVENPRSVQQVTGWLRGKGVEVDTLGKKDVAEMIKEADGGVKEVLELRQQISKTSVKKYTAMLNAAGADDRCRGMFQFYGASRTGRFAGRLVQLQNLPQNHLVTLKEARELVRSGNYEALAMLYDSVPNVLSELIRTAFIPADGKKFIVIDWSAIEARCISWLAGEQWRMDSFANGEDIYCAAASKMFDVRVVKNGENGHLRQKGKVAELALGYQGASGALIAMGALSMGLKENELSGLVSLWRASNPRIVKFWYDVENAAVKAIKEKTTTSVRNVSFTCRNGMLFVGLPSGRSLAYVKPHMGINRYGSESITYEGTGATKKWERLETFGGKLVENITQAVARDLLCFAMGNLTEYNIVAHVHDEFICEVDKSVTVDEIADKMAIAPEWASGLLLKADGYECEFYKKD